MASVGNTVLTLTDYAKRLDPDNKIARVIEMLNQQNDMLEDVVWKEGNLPTGHRTTVRVGLPSVAWRILNGGVIPSKSKTAQLDEQCGMLEAFCEVDVDLAKLNGDEAAFRLSEASAFIEAMNQEMAGTLIYGNGSVSPEEFTGLSVRYSSLGALNGQNIIDAGGTQSDNTSIWLVLWGDQTMHGIYPKGSQAGLFHEDLGSQLIQVQADIGTARMMAYVDHWQWKCGFALKDWRYAVRICNIDVSNLVGESSAADLVKLMSRAIDRIPSFKMGRAAFYANRTLYSMLRIQALNKSQNVLSVDEALDQFGSVRQGTLRFQGIPCRLVDQITNGEPRVV